MTAQHQVGADPHWLHAVQDWPRVRFPLDSLKPHGHEFATTSDARDYNDGMCQDCGLRVLHLWLNSREWVRRRTETVNFLDDRTVRRQVTVDFVTPAYAPTLVVAGQEMDMVPVALLQKKSLVHFDLLDEHGATLSLLGLRQQQTVTAAALKGLAETLPDASSDAARRALDAKLVECLVFGDRPLVRCAMQSLTADPDFAHLRGDALFLMAAERFLDNWMMVLLLPRQDNTRRILKFSFDEPLDLHYEAGFRGFCADPDDLEPPAYQLQDADDGVRTSVWWSRLKAGLGLDPVRIRFPIFSAESAQSYHLEVTAPQGAMIFAAHALASRPEDGSGCTRARPRDAEVPRASTRCGGAALAAAASPPLHAAAGTHASSAGGARGPGNIPGPVFDQVVGIQPTVDLHLTDVPSGAFSQAQVELRAQLSGWLFSMTVACWVNTALLLALTLSGVLENGSESAEIAVTLLVVFVSFAVTVVTQQDAHPMLGRLLLYAKGLAGASSVCALLVAAQVAFTSAPRGLLWAATVVSLLCAALLTIAAYRSRPRRPNHDDVSPWDFTVPMGPSNEEHGRRAWCPGPVDERPQDDAAARRKLGLDRPAIPVATAEGVRHRTRWTTSVERQITDRLIGALRCVDRDNDGVVGTRFTRSSGPTASPSAAAGGGRTVQLRASSSRPAPAAAQHPRVPSDGRSETLCPTVGSALSPTTSEAPVL